jgi:DNA (cytosine-5)-methyltransferase 1
MMDQTILRKIERLARGGKPRALDLFSGCGGISLGLQAAGLEIAGSVEFDQHAAKSHGTNFHAGNSRHSSATDIVSTTPQQLAAKLGLGSVENAIDVVVGGPPCQAFARVGRPKLREVDAHPEAFIHDPRARLYKEYLRYVDAFRPLAVLMENVPDILNHGGQNVAEETCEILAAKGFECRYTLLNSVFYGVPQMRERMVLIAYRRELGAEIRFPAPTHWAELPPGYEGSRAVALKFLKGGVTRAHSYVPAPAATPRLPPAVTAEQAIGDLPPIHARDLLASGELRRGARRLDKPVPYVVGSRLSSYARLMRNWPGYEAPEAGIHAHVIRYLPRDYALFARMNAGDQYPQAHAHAIDMFSELLERQRGLGIAIGEKSKAYRALWDSVVPPYDVSKFPNKWRKMWANQPARTLMAHLGKDSYSHIHYDSSQARTISVREAARLQSFPDGFVFSGSMNAAFKQIGNAVPPLLAKALGECLVGALSDKTARRRSVRRDTDLAAA